MLLTGFTTQNLAMATTFGAYGLIVATLTREFQTSNSLVALGLGMISLCVGLAAPVVGTLLDRWSVRSVMLLGALTAAIGFITAAQAQSIAVFLFCFGLLVGLGITFVGPLPSAKLAGGWFPQAPGKAIGFIGIALLIRSLPLTRRTACKVMPVRRPIAVQTASHRDVCGRSACLADCCSRAV